MTTRDPLSFVDPNQPPSGGLDLARFMAAVRLVETGSAEGNYLQIGQRVRGYTPRGAYAISPENWEVFSREAGIPDADWRSPQAQDLVASTQMQRLFQRYGNWDLVAAAWFAGPDSADNMAKRGYVGVEGIGHRQIGQYVSAVVNATTDEATAGFLGTFTPTTQYTAQGSWLHPVAGESEWSRGSWMPNTLTHRGRTHAAVDIYAASGTPIVSPVGGRVIAAGTGKIGGNWARIQGDDGNVYYFAHMKAAAVVSKGQRISAGAHVGFVGKSGSASATSPHLHMSITRGGRAVNPATMLEGATAGGGTFSMDPERAVMPDSEAGGMGRMLSGWVQGLADTVAGGSRNDPRELISLEEPETEFTDQEKREQAALFKEGAR